MARMAKSAGETKTRRAIVKLLKTEGAMDSAQLSQRLGLTAMGVRQHLYALQDEKLVAADERQVGIGRPVKYWRLTRDADRLFPDAYAELSVALIDALGDTFGNDGLLKVLETRCARQQVAYRQRIPGSWHIGQKLEELARIRTEEGYMAEVRPNESGGFLFVENHCPICAAASACKGFCATELDLFRSVLGSGVNVQRTDHIVSGDRRCAYLVCASPGEG